jgi:hypothetical protein
MNVRQKLIQELEEDGFCEIDESCNEHTILTKSFKYSRPIFSDPINMITTYLVRIHILENEFMIYASHYISIFFLNECSIKEVKKIINCVDNALLSYSIYNEEGFNISIEHEFNTSDITKYYVVTNNERIYLTDEDFENKFFKSIYDQVKQINKQTKITKAVLEHIENKQMLS